MTAEIAGAFVPGTAGTARTITATTIMTVPRHLHHGAGRADSMALADRTGGIDPALMGSAMVATVGSARHRYLLNELLSAERPHLPIGIAHRQRQRIVARPRHADPALLAW